MKKLNKMINEIIDLVKRLDYEELYELWMYIKENYNEH